MIDRRNAALVRKCAACGTANRVPAENLADTGRCGSCKGPIPPAADPIDADPALFDDVVQRAAVPVRVALDHVRVRTVVAADREAPRRRARCPRRPGRALMALHVRRRAEPAVRLNRQHRDGPAAVVGDQRVLPRRMDAHVRRPRAF